MNEQQLSAVKQALDALDCIYSPLHVREIEKVGKAITALQSIISQDALDKKADNARELGLSYDDAPAPVQEPVAYQLRHPNVNFGNWYTVDMERHRRATKDFERRELVVANTTPPAAQPVPVKTYHDGKPWPVAPKPWVGLTDEEVDDAARYCVKSGQSVNAAIRAIEAKLKEKNGL